MRDFGVKLNGLYGKGKLMLKKIYTAAIIGTGRIAFYAECYGELRLRRSACVILAGGHSK